MLSYTCEVKKALSLSKKIASEGNRKYVEHFEVLFGLMKQKELAYYILVGDFYVDINKLEKKLVSLMKSGNSEKPAVFSETAGHILSSANRFAKERKFKMVGEESILYGLLKVASSTSDLLFECGVGLDEFVLGVDARVGSNSGFNNSFDQLINIKVNLESLFDDTRDTVVEGNITKMSERDIFLFRSGALNIKTPFGKYKRIKDYAKVVDGRPYRFLEYIRRGN